MGKDSLQRIQKRINIDQRNLVSARVVSVGTSTARVRLPDGSERTVGNSGSYLPGDQVSVSIYGSVAEIQGSASLQRTGGLRTVEI